MNKAFKSSLGNRQWCGVIKMSKGSFIGTGKRVAICAPKLPKPVHRGTVTIKLKDSK